MQTHRDIKYCLYNGLANYVTMIQSTYFTNMNILWHANGFNQQQAEV